MDLETIIPVSRGGSLAANHRDIASDLRRESSSPWIRRAIARRSKDVAADVTPSISHSSRINIRSVGLMADNCRRRTCATGRSGSIAPQMTTHARRAVPLPGGPPQNTDASVRVAKRFPRPTGSRDGQRAKANCWNARPIRKTLRKRDRINSRPERSVAMMAHSEARGDMDPKTFLGT